MKRFFSLLTILILSLIMIVGLTACPGNDNNPTIDNTVDNNTIVDNKKELNTVNATTYFGIDLKVDAGTFKLKENVAGASVGYGISGAGTMTFTIYPKQPIKCYNVEMIFSNKTPKIYGFEIKFTGTPSINVPANGNATYSVKLEYNLINAKELSNQVVLWGRSESEIKQEIERIQTYVDGSPVFARLTHLDSISGYVITE